MPETKERCCARKKPAFPGQVTCGCSRRATVIRDGEPYCWQHDPDARDEHFQARMADLEAMRDRERAAQQKAARLSAAKSAVYGLAKELLRQVDQTDPELRVNTYGLTMLAVFDKMAAAIDRAKAEKEPDDA